MGRDAESFWLCFSVLATECLLQLLLCEDAELHGATIGLSCLSPQLKFQFLNLLSKQAVFAILLFLHCPQACMFTSQRVENIGRDAVMIAIPLEPSGDDSTGTTHRVSTGAFAKLGFITAQQDAAGNVVFAEDQRAPSDLMV